MNYMENCIKYDSFRDFVERKYNLDIFEAVKNAEMMDCLYRLYRIKYIDTDIYGDDIINTER